MEFLQKITLTGQYSRDKRGNKKFWFVEDKKETVGFFLGWRTLYDGEIYYDSEEGITFTRTGYQKAALVIVDSKTNPIYVPEYSLTII